MKEIIEYKGFIDSDCFTIDDIVEMPSNIKKDTGEAYVKKRNPYLDDE